jgi:hypothetical protein
MSGRRNPGTTITDPTVVAERAATSRKSFGGIPNKSDAESRVVSGARCGSVNTTRPEIGLDNDPTKVAHPYRSFYPLLRRPTNLARCESLRLGVLQADRNLARREVPASVAMILFAGASDVYGLGLGVLLRLRPSLGSDRQRDRTQK